MVDSLGKKPTSQKKSPTLSDHQLYGHLHARHRARRLSAKQRQALDDLLPKIEIPEIAEIDHAKAPEKLFDFSPDQIWLEIGFGAGEHLLRMMRAHPHIGFIGCEPYLTGMARFVAQLDPKKDHNIRLYRGDGRDLLTQLASCAPQSIGRIILLYPDPWPKTRHWARRFIQKPVLDLCAKIMQSEAQLHFASDDPVLTAWVLAHILAHRDFAWRDPLIACQPPKASALKHPATRYEAKAFKQNRLPARLVFCRQL